MTPIEEHVAGLHEDGFACADCPGCARLGWLDEFDLTTEAIEKLSQADDDTP